MKKLLVWALFIMIVVTITGCGGVEEPVISTSLPCEVEQGSTKPFRLNSNYPSGATIRWETTLGDMNPATGVSTQLSIPENARAGDTFFVNVYLVVKNKEYPGSIECEVIGNPDINGSPPTEEPTTENDDEPTEEPTQPTNGGGSDLADVEVWFATYPMGAEVYVAPQTVDLYSLQIEDVVQPMYLVGKTPVIEDLPAGNYYVVAVFTADMYDDTGIDLPRYSDPTYGDAFPFDGNAMSSVTLTGGEDIESIYRVYRLNKTASNSEALIMVGLPLPENERGQGEPNIYPTAATVAALPENFTFKQDVMRGAINDKLAELGLTGAVSNGMVNDMIDVLTRVGKVKLSSANGDMIIHLTGFDMSSFVISTYQ